MAKSSRSPSAGFWVVLLFGLLILSNWFISQIKRDDAIAGRWDALLEHQDSQMVSTKHP